MKRLTYGIGTLLCLALALGGCDTNPLDIAPSDRIGEDAVWQDVALTEAFLNSIYRGLDHGANQSQLSTISDEASSVPDRGTSVVLLGTVTPGDQGILSGTRSNQFKWNDLYAHIRNVNIFLSEIDGAAIADAQRKDRLKGEAHFLRAYFYHNLLRAYGGVPIVTDVAELGDTDLNVPRNSFAETVDFIVEEADRAAALLPATRSGKDLGRASKGAALALKSRVLLFAASDLYHVNPSGRPETGYTSAVDRMGMWRDALNAARAVMDLGVYELYRPNPAPGDSVGRNYYEVFHTPNTPEAILERYFTDGDRNGTNQNYRPHIYHGPNGYHQWGGSTPTQQLVDAYEMRDGTPFDWSDPAHAARPYADRDPRFYATVLYDGAGYRPRPADTRVFDADNVIQTFQRLELPDGSTVPGVDTRDSPVEPWNGTWSGYYIRKILSDTSPREAGQVPGIWLFFRFAETLLNYAEAAIEVGDEAAARDALNRIRRRAGMPALAASLTGPALRDAYRHERRVEMAFEEQRFFDIRRWMIAPEVMNEDAAGVRITAKATDRADRDSYTDYRYERMTYQQRLWADKVYFFPIPSDEMNRNDQLVQNPGY